MPVRSIAAHLRHTEMAGPPSASNPLSSGQQQSKNREHPLMAHAKLAAFAHGMPQEQLPGKTDLTSYVTPILGTLAGDPKVTSKDVVKAAAGAVADGKIAASDAVKFLSGVPEDPDQLRPWLKSLYSANMTALVHMKAAMMKNAAPAQPPVAGPPAVPQGVAAPAAPVAPPQGQVP